MTPKRLFFGTVCTVTMLGAGASFDAQHPGMAFALFMVAMFFAAMLFGSVLP